MSCVTCRFTYLIYKYRILEDSQLESLGKLEELCQIWHFYIFDFHILIKFFSLNYRRYRLNINEF